MLPRSFTPNARGHFSHAPRCVGPRQFRIQTNQHGTGWIWSPAEPTGSPECAHNECAFHCPEERSLNKTAAPNSVIFQLVADAPSLIVHLNNLLEFGATAVVCDL